MDAVMFVIVAAAMIFGVLSIWAHYAGRKRGYIDLSFVRTFMAALLMLGLLLAGVPWYIAGVIVFAVAVVETYVRRRSWRRELDRYER